MNWLRGKEPAIAWISILSGGLLAFLGTKLPANSYQQSLIANFAVGMVQLGIGLFLINVYLDRKARKNAVSSLLQLVTPSIQENHNALLTEVWNIFGRPQWGEVLTRYAKNNGNPHALTPEERKKIYILVKAQWKAMDLRFTKLESDLRELALVLGWSFDPSVLSSSFKCRYAISRIRLVNLDDSQKSEAEVCEQFLDIEINSSHVFHRLVQLLGIDKEQVYADRIN